MTYDNDYGVISDKYFYETILFVVHVDYENHRLVMIDLGDNDVVHVDYK